MSQSGSKPYEISKQVVMAAFEKVRAKKGAPGIDGVTVEQFAQDGKNNLYKLWNRMSSGSYFPAPVRMVEIPKDGGRGTRILGVPTVADRIAQTVAVAYLEPLVENLFHADSYGYRPGRSPLDAGGNVSGAVLEVRMGSRPGHRGLLRQPRSRSDSQGGRSPHG
jgi:retron-type reverse transcriptase